MTRQSYPTDLTDAQWERLGPYLPTPKSGTRKGGRPAADLREVVNAVVYQLRGGPAWRLLPHDFPPRQTVYGHFRRWRDDGTWERFTTGPGRAPGWRPSGRPGRSPGGWTARP